MSNPYWNLKLVSENGVLRSTMGIVLGVMADPPPTRAQVRLGLFKGDGSQTVDVVIPVIGLYVEGVDVNHPVMVLFMGDTFKSGVVMGRVDWLRKGGCEVRGQVYTGDVVTIHSIAPPVSTLLRTRNEISVATFPPEHG